MNTKLIMVASSVFLGLVGLAASFAPEELLRALGAPAGDPVPLLVQLLGATYLAFAITNWTAKANIISAQQAPAAAPVKAQHGRAMVRAPRSRAGSLACIVADRSQAKQLG